MVNFFDSHAHLTSDAVYEDLSYILERAQAAGVGSIVNICTDKTTLERGLELKKSCPWIYNAGATTPHDALEQGEEMFPVFEDAAKKGSLVAIGETGLDYYYFHETKQEQQDLLRRYLRLALETKLPVIIHCRDAFEDFFKILDEEYVVDGKHAPGVLHCFTGTLKEAGMVVDRGWYLSLSGIATFKRSDELRAVARHTPVDQLLIETDTPYLAPQSKRGKTNEPAYIVETAQLIANEKGVDLDYIAEKTRENASQLFNP